MMMSVSKYCPDCMCYLFSVTSHSHRTHRNCRKDICSCSVLYIQTTSAKNLRYVVAMLLLVRGLCTENRRGTWSLSQFNPSYLWVTLWTVSDPFVPNLPLGCVLCFVRSLWLGANFEKTSWIKETKTARKGQGKAKHVRTLRYEKERRKKSVKCVYEEKKKMGWMNVWRT